MKRLLLLLVFSATLFSCKKDNPQPVNSDFGAYYNIDKSVGILGYPGDGVYYRASLAFKDFEYHPSGVASLIFSINRDGKLIPVKINWNFAVGTPYKNVRYYTWTNEQSRPGDIISDKIFYIQYTP